MTGRAAHLFGSFQSLQASCIISNANEETLSAHSDEILQNVVALDEFSLSPFISLCEKTGRLETILVRGTTKFIHRK